MSIKDNINTVAGNAAQQISAAVVLLVLPYVVSVTEYGQIIFLSTLLSFVGLADLGIAYVYGRKMPAVYQRNNAEEIEGWNSTVLRYRVYTAVVFGLLIAALYLVKYGQTETGALLVSFVVLSVFTAFFTASATAKGRFDVSRNITVAYSITRLLVLPGALVGGVFGWMAAQLIAVGALFRSRVMRRDLGCSWSGRGSIDWRLIRSHIPEALSLGVITTLWLQLLASARTFASFIYPDEIIAIYGLSNAVYQGVGMLIVAAFVPQTVKVYRLLAQDRKAAINYTVKTILIFQVLMLIGVSLLVPLSNWFFGQFFPHYAISAEIVRPMMLSLAFYPAMVTTGVLLTGTGRHRLYLGLVLVAVAINFGLVWVVFGSGNNTSAALAQMVTLSCYALIQIVVLVSLFGREIAGVSRLLFPTMTCLAVPAYDMYLRGWHL